MTYEGWKEIGKNRYELVGKEFVAGYRQEKKWQILPMQTCIVKYDMNKVELRVLNN